MYLLKLCLTFMFLNSGFSDSTHYYTEIGEDCGIGYNGTCRRIHDCQIAYSFLQNKQHLPHCFFEHTTDPIVCCPNDTTNIRTGPKDMLKVFRDSLTLKTDEMICIFENQEPFLCCENPPDNIFEAEPKECPPLPKPDLGTALRHPAWEKCLSYQQYFNVCISDRNSKFIRQDTGNFSSDTLRILGGQPAVPRQFPHMAVIGSADTHETNDIKWIGGGTLISDKFILTAAHVVIETKGGFARYALLGAVSKKDVKGGLLCNIVKRHGYKFYEGTKKDHDIALVELLHRVQFNEFIRPACLPVEGSQIKESFMVAGWGKTDTSDNSTVLLYTYVRENNVYCMKNLKDTFNNVTMICTQGVRLSENITPNSCTGDSGGPLMAEFQNLNRSYSVEGVVSYGPGCDKGVGVYTRVSYYMDFIMETVWPDDWSVYKQRDKEEQQRRNGTNKN